MTAQLTRRLSQQSRALFERTCHRRAAIADVIPGLASEWTVVDVSAAARVMLRHREGVFVELQTRDNAVAEVVIFEAEVAESISRRLHHRLSQRVESLPLTGVTIGVAQATMRAVLPNTKYCGFIESASSRIYLEVAPMGIGIMLTTTDSIVVECEVLPEVATHLMIHELKLLSTEPTAPVDN